MKVEEDGEEKKVLMLKRLDSEPNLWKVVLRDEDPGEEEEVRGLVMTYVDDLFLVGTRPVVEAVLKEIQGKWKTSEPEEVSATPVRFLGMDIYKRCGEKGLDEWIVTQRLRAGPPGEEEEDPNRQGPRSRAVGDRGFPNSRPNPEGSEGSWRVVVAAHLFHGSPGGRLW